MELLMHVNVFTCKFFNGLSANEKFGTFHEVCYDGWRPVIITGGWIIECEFHCHITNEISLITRYTANNCLPKVNITVKLTFNIINRKLGVSSKIHQEIRKLWISCEPLVLNSSGGKSQ